jgi:hypothetical protein
MAVNQENREDSQENHLDFRDEEWSVQVEVMSKLSESRIGYNENRKDSKEDPGILSAEKDWSVHELVVP